MSEESTPSDPVAVVTSMFEAADRGDWDAVLRSYAPDATLESEDGITDQAGASQMRGFWEEWAGMFEDWTIKVETVVDLGNGVVYAVYNSQGRPAGSTAVVTERACFILEWVNGTIARAIVGTDIDDARAAAERRAQERG